MAELRTLMPVLVFFVVGTLSWFVIYQRSRVQVAASRRLKQHAVQIETGNRSRIEEFDLLANGGYSANAALNRLFARYAFAERARVALLRAHLRISVAQFVLIRIALGLVAATALVILVNLAIVALPGFLIGFFLPLIVVTMKANRRRKAFEAQLAEAIDLLVGALRAGYGFLQAIESASQEIEQPMRGELALVVERVNVGTPVTDALAELPKRIDSYDLSLFVAAISVQRSVGGNLAEVLENIAHTVRERRRIRAEVRALTTGPRASSYILGLFPVGLMLYFAATDGGYRNVMLGDRVGQMILLGAGIWTLIGFFLSSAVAKVEY